MCFIDSCSAHFFTNKPPCNICHFGGEFNIFCCCIQASYAQKIFSTSYANQADIKVFVVKYPNQADLKVYKVAYSNQAKGNEGNWYFVNYSNQSDKKVYFTQYINQADLKIYFVNYSNQAGWVQVSKKHLVF